MKSITLEQAMDMFQDDLAELYTEMHRDDGYLDSERAFEKLVTWCAKAGYQIEDEDTVQYDRTIDEDYRNTDLEA